MSGEGRGGTEWLRGCRGGVGCSVVFWGRHAHQEYLCKFFRNCQRMSKFGCPKKPISRLLKSRLKREQFWPKPWGQKEMRRLYRVQGAYQAVYQAVALRAISRELHRRQRMHSCGGVGSLGNVWAWRRTLVPNKKLAVPSTHR